MIFRAGLVSFQSNKLAFCVTLAVATLPVLWNSARSATSINSTSCFCSRISLCFCFESGADSAPFCHHLFPSCVLINLSCFLFSSWLCSYINPCVICEVYGLCKWASFVVLFSLVFLASWPSCCLAFDALMLLMSSPCFFPPQPVVTCVCFLLNKEKPIVSSSVVKFQTLKSGNKIYMQL